MIDACRVVFKHNGAFLLQAARAEFDPLTLAKECLSPFRFNEDDTKAYKIDGKIVEGYLVANSNRCYEGFFSKYLAKDDDNTPETSKARLKRRIYRKRRMRHHLDDDIIQNDGGTEFITDAESGSEYLFVKEGIVLFDWREKNGAISPLFLGRYAEGGRYYYYSASPENDGKAVIRTADSLKKVPRHITSAFKKRSFNLADGIQMARSRLEREKRHIMSCCVDFLPFPPYEVLGAFRLLPPNKVAKASPEPLPDILKKPCFLKTFLVTQGEVPIAEAGAGVLRSLSLNLQKNFFMPDVKTEDADMEYTNLYNNSAGYVLVCKPKWVL